MQNIFSNWLIFFPLSFHFWSFFKSPLISLQTQIVFHQIQHITTAKHQSIKQPKLKLHFLYRTIKSTLWRRRKEWTLSPKRSFPPLQQQANYNNLTPNPKTTINRIKTKKKKLFHELLWVLYEKNENETQGRKKMCLSFHGSTK